MMTFCNKFRWAALITVNVVTACVLGLYQPGSAAPKEPFANAVEQRAEMIDQLKQIAALLKEQNALLRSAPAKNVIIEGKP